jgi:ribonuclease HIII
MYGTASYKIDLNQEPAIKSELERTGFRFSDFQYAYWRAMDEQHAITLYRSGKLLIQGKDPNRITAFLTGKGLTLLSSHPIHPAKQSVSKWIGTDESGNGAYFGPLTVAGVLVTRETQKELVQMGVRDSKSLSDYAIKELAPKIKELCPHSILAIDPILYNGAYETLRGFGKYYRILARGHARVIENILAEETCHHAVVDQFGAEKFMVNALALMEKGRLIRLEQRTHAEDDLAVAAASILARDEYKKGLEALSTKYSIDLPAGASNKVIQAGKEFVSRYGKDELRETAKIHFVTTKHILDPDFFNKANT